jgi:hypothetical protein
MEMGLGKTLTTLADFQRAVNNGAATRMLVGCPNSFKSGWREEIHKHGFDFDVHIFESGSIYNTSFIKKRFTRPPVMIINYEAIRSAESQGLLSAYGEAKNSFVAWDESIQLKTHDSAQTKAAIAVAKSYDIKRILSGKPITQGPHDLSGQFRAIGALKPV